MKLKQLYISMPLRVAVLAISLATKSATASVNKVNLDKIAERLTEKAARVQEKTRGVLIITSKDRGYTVKLADVPHTSLDGAPRLKISLTCTVELKPKYGLDFPFLLSNEYSARVTSSAPVSYIELRKERLVVDLVRGYEAWKGGEVWGDRMLADQRQSEYMPSLKLFVEDLNKPDLLLSIAGKKSYNAFKQRLMYNVTEVAKTTEETVEAITWFDTACSYLSIYEK